MLNLKIGFDLSVIYHDGRDECMNFVSFAQINVILFLRMPRFPHRCRKFIQPTSTSTARDGNGDGMQMQ